MRRAPTSRKEPRPADFVARDRNYAGTGDYRKPFGPRVASPVLTGRPAFDHVL
ncbi:hypothetical protein ACFZCF_24805 [Streptomyces sp. NPDC007945]|uniref:hypothetical protein n=1 Tax=Streptomyces sp. NPDC007945 TaxID=3364797 RepID=UPI0036E8C118